MDAYMYILWIKSGVHLLDPFFLFIFYRGKFLVCVTFSKLSLFWFWAPVKWKKQNLLQWFGDFRQPKQRKSIFLANLSRRFWKAKAKAEVELFISTWVFVTWMIAWKKHIPKTIFLQFLPRACSSKKSLVISVKARRMLALSPFGGSFVTWWLPTE